MFNFTVSAVDLIRRRHQLRPSIDGTDGQTSTFRPPLWLAMAKARYVWSFESIKEGHLVTFFVFRQKFAAFFFMWAKEGTPSREIFTESEFLSWQVSRSSGHAIWWKSGSNFWTFPVVSNVWILLLHFLGVSNRGTIETTDYRGTVAGGSGRDSPKCLRVCLILACCW